MRKENAFYLRMFTRDVNIRKSMISCCVHRQNKAKQNKKKKTKQTQNPRKDYFVMTRQAGGTQYLY